VRACVQGHDIIGYTPRPQQSVAWSAQTLAHGATQLLFFRYRAAVFGQEEFCYGVRCRRARAHARALRRGKAKLLRARGARGSERDREIGWG
jgi:beta-galactosidase GanA